MSAAMTGLRILEKTLLQFDSAGADGGGRGDGRGVERALGGGHILSVNSFHPAACFSIIAHNHRRTG